jgi:hypothetical protein
MSKIRDAAQDLYDNRLGWSDGRNPYAPPKFWENLGEALKAPAYRSPVKCMICGGNFEAEIDHECETGTS